MAEETEKKTSATGGQLPVEEVANDEPEILRRPRLRDVFRQALERARREQKPAVTQQQKGRDRSKSLFLIVGAAIAVLLLFLGVFSSPNSTKNPAAGRRPGTPDLGRRETPGQRPTDQMGSVTPLMSADTSQADISKNQSVTADDVNKTARPTQTPPGSARTPVTTELPGNSEQYAIGQIDFSDSEKGQTGGSVPTPQPSHGSASGASTESIGLQEPSLVFVRSVQASSAGLAPRPASERPEESGLTLDLPAGTRIVARLQSVANSAVRAPVIAAIEYNYERDGEIVVPAGAKALGSLQQADRSGYVAIHFDTLEMPDGTTAKIDATAMSLTYGALKGTVSGKKTGTRFLVRAFTGLGTVAAYLVGGGGGNGINGPLSESALLRDRIATNIGIAGDQELTNLAFNQNIVITIPGNTRFYLVLQKSSAAGTAGTNLTSLPTQTATNARLPSLEELRELVQLRRELSEMYQPSSPQGATQQPPQ
jgi:hypothetical protein